MHRSLTSISGINPSTVREREALSDEALRPVIERGFPARLGGLEQVTSRASFPIRRQHARHYGTLDWLWSVRRPM